jgi:uncharacterized FlaG/YvyC family protein
MASDGSPGAIAAVSAVLNSQASGSTKFQPAGGKTLPQSGNSSAAAAAVALTSAENVPQGNKTVTPAVSSASVKSSAAVGSGNSAANASSAKSAAAATADPQSLVTQINKHLNNSGQADQFRVDPDSNSYIQQVNPASGEVIAQYAVNEFPALARSIGAAGLLIDDTA